MNLQDLISAPVEQAIQLEPPPPQPQAVSVDPPKNAVEQVSTTKVYDQAFQASLLKSSLHKALDAPPPPPKIDYFEIDKQADEIIKKHTSSNFFGSSLDTEGVAKDLADIAKTDPTRAHALTDNVLDKISDSDKGKAAQHFVDSLDSNQLRELAKTDDGRAMLEQLKGNIHSGFFPWEDRSATVHRIETALKMAGLEKTPEFQKLSPEVQNEVRAQAANNETNTKAVDNLIKLVSSPGFNTASADAQKAMLKAYGNRSEDSIFNEAMANLTGKPEFTALGGAQQARVIDDLDKFAKTESYQGSGGFLGIGGHHVSDDDKKALLEMVGNISVFSAAHPTDAIVRNTLDHVLNGEIRLDAYDKKPKNGIIEFGYADGNSIHLNKTTTLGDTAKLVETLAHETNHFLNDHPISSDADKPERFLDEYRAFITGFEASEDRALTSRELKGILDNLRSDAYPHLRDQYNNDPKFRAVIDEAYTRLGKGEKVSSEDFRQMLLKAGFSSDYLNKPGNLDNH